MNLFSKSEIKNLFRKHQIQPSKRLGQNFLIKREAVRKIIEAINPQSKEIILEIGPGLGVITLELAKKIKKIIAVEKDKNMVKILKEVSADFKNLEIFQEDILRFDLRDEASFINKVVGNLPFYLTAPVIRKFLEKTEIKPLQMVLVVQKELAQRICAKPPRMNLLAISVQFYAKPKIISYLSKKFFWPQPKVDSAILQIVPLTKNEKKLVDANLFFKVVKAGFSQPRKQILNNLSKSLNLDKEKVESWLRKNGLQARQRAESLEIKDWINLARSFPS